MRVYVWFSHNSSIHTFAIISYKDLALQIRRYLSHPLVNPRIAFKVIRGKQNCVCGCTGKSIYVTMHHMGLNFKSGALRCIVQNNWKRG